MGSKFVQPSKVLGKLAAYNDRRDRGERLASYFHKNYSLFYYHSAPLQIYCLIFETHNFPRKVISDRYIPCSFSIGRLRIFLFSILFRMRLYSYFPFLFPDSRSSVTISLRYKIAPASNFSIPGLSFLLAELGNSFINYGTRNLRKAYTHSKIHIQPAKGEEEGGWVSVARNCTTLFLAAPQSPGPAPPRTTLRAQRRKCVVKYLTWSIPSPPPAAEPLPLLNPSHSTRALPPSIPAGSIASYEHPVLCIIKYATPTSRYSDFMGNPWMK